jgi:hypothetical protein
MKPKTVFYLILIASVVLIVAGIIGGQLHETRLDSSTL